MVAVNWPPFKTTKKGVPTTTTSCQDMSRYVKISFPQFSQLHCSFGYVPAKTGLGPPKRMVLPCSPSSYLKWAPFAPNIHPGSLRWAPSPLRVLSFLTRPSENAGHPFWFPFQIRKPGVPSKTTFLPLSRAFLSSCRKVCVAHEVGVINAQAVPILSVRKRKPLKKIPGESNKWTRTQREAYNTPLDRCIVCLGCCIGNSP